MSTFSFFIRDRLRILARKSIGESFTFPLDFFIILSTIYYIDVLSFHPFISMAHNMIGQEELFSPSVLPDTDTGDTRDQLENILSEESKVSEGNPSFEESPSFEHHERLTPSSAQFRKDLKTTLSDDAEALEAQKQALAEKIVNTYLWNKPSHTRQVLRYLVILSEVCEHPEWASLNMDFLSDIYYHKMQPN